MNTVEKIVFWTSRSSFSSTDADIVNAEITNKPNQVVDHNRNNDLINLKSSTNADSKFRRSKSVTLDDAEIQNNPHDQINSDRVNTVSSVDRFSTLLTPTATSFSRDELNEIFNIGRENMDVEKAKENHNLSLDTSIQSNNENTLHNVALNQSDISLDNSIISNPSDLTDSGEISMLSTESLPTIKQTKEPVVKPLVLKETFLEPQKQYFENGEIMNPRVNPFTASPDKNTTFSHVQMVCREIYLTERTYVNDLQEVIEGYIYHLKQQTDLDVESIFGNLEAIYEFNKDVLYEIEQCEVEENEFDLVEIAKIFCEKARGFNHHYTQYCTNYPEASAFFSTIMQDVTIGQFFLGRQKVIGHALSLESYLLKPVQRIMKYHLLFRDILKKYDGDEEGYNTINTAALAMSDVAEYINEMKRLQEDAVKVQQILSTIVDLDVPIDVYETGRLVLENTFKIQGARGDRFMYLFEKLLLICKKNEDKLYQFKEKIECSNMMLLESIGKDPLAFQIMRFDNQKINYTILAKTIEIKKEWTQHLKRLILESHASSIPQTARQAILGVEEKAKSKYTSLPMQALDDSVMGNIRNMKKNAPKAPTGKENVSLATGVKRESNEKDSSNVAKRSLNVKAKEYLYDKKNRRSGSPTNMAQSPSPDKKKDKIPWIRRHKHKPSLDSALMLETSIEDLSNEHFYQNKAEIRVKSRSLESLKDSIKRQDNKETKAESAVLNDINYDYEQQDDKLKTGKRSRPTPMTDNEGSTNSLLNSGDSVERINKLLKGNAEQSGPQNGHLGVKITKSVSMTLPRNVSKTREENLENVYENPHRWSTIPNEAVQLERLEKRLSILNDDDSSVSIKDTVRKVSNAFNSSFQTYEDSPRSVASNEMDVSRDLGLILGTAKKTVTPSYRRSTGMLGSGTITPIALNRSRSELSVFKDKNIAETNVITKELKLDSFTNSTEECLSPQPLHTELVVIDPIIYQGESNEWSADVDQVFDEVNADIDSMADSIASDTKSNSSDCDAPTTIAMGMDISQRAAFVDQRLKEANKNFTSPNSARKINVEVKRVADRIKEYKKLVDAEKRISNHRRAEPKTMNEMIESLDSIKPSTVGSSPVYSSYRRRFKSSRDFENDNDTRVVVDSSGNLSSVPRKNSEEKYIRKLRLLYATESSAKKSNVSVLLSNSSSSLNSLEMKTFKETENITQRTENYQKALKSNEKSKTLNNRNRLLSSDVFSKPQRPTSGEWNLKAATLPHLKRTNAIKRPGKLLSDDDYVSDESHKSMSLPINCSGKLSNGENVSVNKSENKSAVSKSPSRSSSMPPRVSGEITEHIHEEVSVEYMQSKVVQRSKSDSSSLSQDERPSRGRSEAVKHNINSSSEKCLSLQKSRKKNTRVSNRNPTKLSINNRSTSLPRRCVKHPTPVDDLKNELSDEHNLLRSPSIRCIQQNHVNNRIKEYFINLQHTSKMSLSRPNLVLVASSGSDSDNDESSSDGRNSPMLRENNTDHILRGTVRSMIKKYGTANYVFD